MSALPKEPQSRAIDSVPLSDEAVLQGEPLRQFYAYWSQLGGDDPIPLKSDFDVMDILPLSADLLILDLVSPGLDFRFRLVGTGITERLGIDPTEDLISEFPLNLFWVSAAELCRRVILERHPYWRPPLRSSFPDKSYLTVEALLLPLLDDTGDVTQVVGIMHYGDE